MKKNLTILAVILSALAALLAAYRLGTMNPSQAATAMPAPTWTPAPAPKPRTVHLTTKIVAGGALPATMANGLPQVKNLVVSVPPVRLTWPREAMEHILFSIDVPEIKAGPVFNRDLGLDFQIKGKSENWMGCLQLYPVGNRINVYVDYGCRFALDGNDEATLVVYVNLANCVKFAGGTTTSCTFEPTGGKDSKLVVTISDQLDMFEWSVQGDFSSAWREPVNQSLQALGFTQRLPEPITQDGIFRKD